MAAAIESVTPRDKRASRPALPEFAWRPSSTRFYNTVVGDETKHEAWPAARSAYESCYLAVRRSRPERAFEQWLESADAHAVSWWIKNGETAGSDLSLTYVDEDGQERNFFPDYIVGLQDGTLCLFETKEFEEAFLDDDQRLATNTRKLAALAAWVAEAPVSQPRFGGFVVRPSGKRDALYLSTGVPPTASHRGEHLPAVARLHPSVLQVKAKFLGLELATHRPSISADGFYAGHPFGAHVPAKAEVDALRETA